MNRWQRTLGPDGNFYETLALAADVVIVNACLIVSSLPIVTAGEAQRRAVAVIAQLAADEGSRPVRTFFHGFGRGRAWGRVSAWWLAMLALGLVAAWILRALLILGGVGALAAGAAVIAGLGLVGVGGTWLVAITAHDPGHPSPWSHAAMCALAHPLRGLGIVVAWIWPWLVLVMWPRAWGMLLLFYVVIGWALTWYVIWLFIRDVVAPPTPADD
ncbi:hypothetical protein H8R18_07920 [Nanchangia anserum]|uniref:DUF624 domain-containing protein n=1 Tax=Nanchangia anserum TaxID=2692125 RepID=A0A8I0GG74_9ACTO|nr:hypothetical protein [Nanchangia anserum]MBD3689449.1 hypothetical protein [Nanchangia anserum]QOX81649.1 hypothetical protein H8R18_07920 [Nanchangia anserum]